MPTNHAITTIWVHTKAERVSSLQVEKRFQLLFERPVHLLLYVEANICIFCILHLLFMLLKQLKFKCRAQKPNSVNQALNHKTIDGTIDKHSVKMQHTTDRSPLNINV